MTCTPVSKFMDPEDTADFSKHLEKQRKLLVEARRIMTQELQKVEVEEEMLMWKFYELMTKHGPNRKEMEENENVAQGQERVQASSSSSSSTSTSI